MDLKIYELRKFKNVLQLYLKIFSKKLRMIDMVELIFTHFPKILGIQPVKFFTHSDAFQQFH